VSILLDIVGSLVMFLMPDLVGKGRGTDRRLLAQRKVRSSIRAVEGRVLNIGTEWSTGVCEIGKGRLRFVPSMGIVGDREIEVIGLRLRDDWSHELVVAPWGESTELIVSTEAGELYWAIPEHIADDVVERLSPVAG